jgi:D-aminopeptidase
VRRPRAREAGVWFGEVPPGPKNAITDVTGVKVGHCTIMRGSGPLVVGKGPVRTGVTAILPHGRNIFREPVKGAYFDLNGCGGLVGDLQIGEFGIIETPIVLTNTMSMGAASEGVVKYLLKTNPDVGLEEDTIIPVVSECDDSYLNDARGLHVKEEHVFAAIEDAKETVTEGAVGSGTGMTCHDYKGGIGTSSRVVEAADDLYTVGVLVMTNHGEKSELRIDGVPVGMLLPSAQTNRSTDGSIVIVIATNAPMDSRQLRRIARRSFLGMATVGSCSANTSGDIALAFSTANIHERNRSKGLLTSHLIQDKDMTPLFRATVDCTAEAIVNSLFKAETVEGRDGNTSWALPIEETLEILKAHGRLKA